MRRTKITSVVAVLLLMEFAQANTNVKGKPTLDLDDYIDNPNSNRKEDLSSSATGYYGHGHPHQPYHGHSHSHTDYHQHHQPIYHHQHAAYGHHLPHHSPYDYGHAQTYFAGEYGGLGHVGSAHVSYGTEINHGHSHHHHHSHGYYG